tara:strand:- start:417 stop:680 length:264 start_codon:yes stop_codon:yes gene_type:complete
MKGNGNNDLTNFKKGENTILATMDEKQKESNPGKAGRKPKPASEKATEQITIKFTPGQYQKLTEKAGLIPIATFLKHQLETNTDVFE